jgi:hypothetical protein
MCNAKLEKQNKRRECYESSTSQLANCARERGESCIPIAQTVPGTRESRPATKKKLPRLKLLLRMTKPRPMTRLGRPGTSAIFVFAKHICRHFSHCPVRDKQPRHGCFPLTLPFAFPLSSNSCIRTSTKYCPVSCHCWIRSQLPGFLLVGMTRPSH